MDLEKIAETLGERFYEISDETYRYKDGYTLTFYYDEEKTKEKGFLELKKPINLV